MKYAALRAESYELSPGGSGQLVALREQDLPLIKEWRNAQIDFLRQEKPLTDEDQRRYYRETTLPALAAARPTTLLFSLLQSDACVGYAGLTYVSWSSRRAEVVFLAATERLKDVPRYQADFSRCLEILKKIAFDELGLDRLFMENYDFRPWHVEALERSGFRLEGRLRRHVVKNGRPLDSLIHGLLKSDAPASAPRP